MGSRRGQRVGAPHLWKYLFFCVRVFFYIWGGGGGPFSHYGVTYYLYGGGGIFLGFAPSYIHFWWRPCSYVVSRCFVLYYNSHAFIRIPNLRCNHYCNSRVINWTNYDIKTCQLSYIILAQ